MRVVLKVASGPFQGRSILLQAGQVIKVGRTEWADFAIPHDDRLSGMHFALQCDGQQCRLRDLESTNGTMVNGAPTLDTLLNDGDQIVAGRTSFVVEVERIVQPAVAETASEAVVTVREPVDDATLVTVSDRPFVSPILSSATVSGRPYDQALTDEDPLVRREALLAAVWTRQPWLLEYCRDLAAQPDPVDWNALWLLGVLGQPSDVERVLGIGRTLSLGSRRFSLYASYGHPRTVKDLLVGMGSKDPNAAVAAGLAFTKITGADIQSQQRVALSPEDGSRPDDFEKEFQEQAFLPNVEQAERHWQTVKSQFAKSARWRQGLDLSRGTTSELLDQLDMEGRYEACLRGVYEGTWRGSPSKFERFPLAATG